MIPGDNAGDRRVSAREQAIEFLMAHEQALEEGQPPPEPPAELLRQLDPADRTRLLQLVAQQRRRTGPPAAPAAPRLGRYVVQEEINHGGMGVVYRGRDQLLEREVAIKVLRDDLALPDDVVQRFKEEAQIASQLQHPGIAPVHDLGAWSDGRPFFTMKLIKGRDLAQLLHERSTPAHDRARFLGIFQQVCQTVAYAHSCHVLHRDLKPSNVMVGEFGEVQVMDWGLGKVLHGNTGKAEPLAGPEAAGPPPTTAEVETVRGRSPQARTSADAILGTFDYMPPEQARGQADAVDERSDVFALGALLCEVLTGQPPYVGDTRAAVRAQAEQADLQPVFARLEASGADGELVALARACLAAEPATRPANAGQVAAAVTAYLNGVQEKLRQAEVERARAEAKAAEERQKRRWQLGLAVAVFLAVSAGVGGWRWVAWQQDRRRLQATRDVVVALTKGEEQRSRIRRAPRDTLAETYAVLGDWKEGLATVEAAAELARANAVDPATRASIEELRQEFQIGVKITEDRIRQTQREERFRTGLRRALEKGQELKLIDFHPEASAVGDLYAAAFREYGIDVLALEPAAVAARLNAETPRVRELAVEALDDWRIVDTSFRSHWRPIVDQLDANPWRQQFRHALDQRDVQTLRQLGQAPEVPPRQAEALGSALRQIGAPQDALALLKRAALQVPNDFGLQLGLGASWVKLRSPGYREAIGCFQAAVALSPSSSVAYTNLGFAQKRAGLLEDAEISFRRALELEPANFIAIQNLAVLKFDQFQLAEVDALTAQVLRLKPGDPETLALRAVAWAAGGRVAAAADLLRQLPESAADQPEVLLSRLAVAFFAGDLDQASALARRLARHPAADVGILFAAVGPILDGDMRAAEAAARATLQRYPVGHFGVFGRILLAVALMYQGRLTEAEAAVQEAFRITGDHLLAGQALRYEILLRQGRFSEAKVVSDLLGRASGKGAPVWLQAAWRWVVLSAFIPEEKRVELIAAGKVPPPTPPDYDAAFVAVLRGLPALSLRLYRGSMRSLPLLALLPATFSGSMQWEGGVTQRVCAARAAALVAAGVGRDAAGATEEERRLARADALQWLQAELKSRQSLATYSNLRRQNRCLLIYWQACPDFAGIRDAGALGKLPEAERNEWHRFWADVDALRNQLDAPVVKE